MADRHDKIVSMFRLKLTKKNYKLARNPFVDYRPDIAVSKNRELIIVEVEIDQTLHSDHTLEQLTKMYKYVRKNKKYRGFLVVPTMIRRQAEFLVESLFGDNKIDVFGIKA